MDEKNAVKVLKWIIVGTTIALVTRVVFTVGFGVGYIRGASAYSNSTTKQS